MRPSLFEVEGFEPGSTTSPAVQTPLGIVELGCSIGGHSLSSQASDTDAGRLREGQILLWESSSLRAELLLSPVHDQRATAPEASDAGCVVATWRLSAHTPTDPVALSIGWSAGATWVDHDTNSGECVDALTFYDAAIVGGRFDRATVEVAFGTVSGDCVERGADGWWPDRWTWEVLGCAHPYCEGLVEYGPGRLTVPLPAFIQGERCLVRFALAWGNPAAEPAPWLRADNALWSTFRPTNV